MEDKSKRIEARIGKVQGIIYKNQHLLENLFMKKQQELRKSVKRYIRELNSLSQTIRLKENCEIKKIKGPIFMSTYSDGGDEDGRWEQRITRGIYCTIDQNRSIIEYFKTRWYSNESDLKNNSEINYSKLSKVGFYDLKDLFEWEYSMEKGLLRAKGIIGQNLEAMSNLESPREQISPEGWTAWEKLRE